MNNLPVSVAIASYNHAKLLRQTLDSLLQQKTLFPLEIVVADDASTDETPRLLREYGDKIIVKNTEDWGHGYRNGVKAKNLALQWCSGDIVIQQSDDVLHVQPNTIEQIAASLVPGEFIACTVYDWDSHTGEMGAQYVGNKNIRPLLFLGATWRKDVCKVGGYDPDFGEVCWRDDNWFGKCLTDGLGLKCSYSTLLGIHQNHQHVSHTPEFRKSIERAWSIYQGKEKAGKFLSSGGPWPYRQGTPAALSGECSLEEIWTFYGGMSDKNTRHSYIPVYEELFKPYRNQPTHLLEIGIGGGDCLVAWSKYFHRGEAVGLDVWTGQEIGNLRKVNGSATSKKVWEENFVSDKFDIIIDDASHIPEEQIITWNLYRGSMRERGIYIIEDVPNIETARELSILGFEIIDRRSIKNIEDDILAVWRAPA